MAETQLTANLALVHKLWNYSNILRDDGLSYGGLLRTNAEGVKGGAGQHFTLKTLPLLRADLCEFVRLYRVGHRLTREATSATQSKLLESSGRIDSRRRAAPRQPRPSGAGAKGAFGQTRKTPWTPAPPRFACASRKFAMH